jgi:hypothetical protein
MLKEKLTKNINHSYSGGGGGTSYFRFSESGNVCRGYCYIPLDLSSSGLSVATLLFSRQTNLSEKFNKK